MMARWHDDKIAELARQLPYSPAEKRAAQLAATCDLLPTLDPAKPYPWEFILFRITGYRPKEPVDHTLEGSTLQADLSQLIEILSDTLHLRTENAKEPVLSLEEVTRQFGVSSKTIQRWRRQGLAAQRFIFSDGRRRIGFLKSVLEQFARQNADRVQNAATFRQLSDAEREKIIRMARRLSTHCQCCLKEMARRIAERLSRSPETIRYTIRNYDQEHPASAIFPFTTDPIRPADRQAILAAFDRGRSVESIAKQYCRTRSSIYRVVSQERAERLKARVIEYVPNPLFEHPEAEQIILHVLPTEALAKAQATVAAGKNAKSQDMLVARVPANLPGFLADIFNQPVMPQEMEMDAFRRMNYLKYKAEQQRQRLDPATANSSEISEIESLLAQARALKNQIVQGSLRVAVHVARRHQRVGGHWRDADLMELVSDASIWLMRAADRFDFARGVKFSTYASYAIMKNFARDRVEQIARPDAKLVTGQEARLEQVRERETPSVSDQVDALHASKDLAVVIQKLPARERELVVAHYGLDQSQPAMSLSELGAKLGITKSRVRQIETRALRKLRRLLEEYRAGGVVLAEAAVS